jgi:glycosyltransferase involved in cell wall biosynthesis
MPDLSIALPYYMNPGMLAIHYAGWAVLPETIKRRIEIVIVDDASPSGAAADVTRPAGLPALSIYRVAEDVPWHQDAARNLGAHAATGRWLLLIDMDHTAPEHVLAKLLAYIDSGRLKDGQIYSMWRRDAKTGRLLFRRLIQPRLHPNCFVVSRETYWHIGGYDEALCGRYGTDGAFKWRAFRKARHRRLWGVQLVRHGLRDFPDAATRGLPKKKGRTPEQLREKTAFHESRRAIGFSEPVPVLTFEWERVA